MLLLLLLLLFHSSLPSLAPLQVGMTQPQLAARAMPLIVGPLCVQCKGPALAALASLLGMTPQTLFVNYAHYAIAYAFWEGPDIAVFIEFVDAIMAQQEDDFLSVAKVTAKHVAQQV